LLPCSLAPCYLIAYCLVLVGTSFFLPILQGGTWSLEKQTF
jgi:hypothetical protein